MKKYWVEMRESANGLVGCLHLEIIEAPSHKEAATAAREQNPGWCVLSTEEIKE